MKRAPEREAEAGLAPGPRRPATAATTRGYASAPASTAVIAAMFTISVTVE